MLSRLAWLIAFLALATGTPALAQDIDNRADATLTVAAFGYGSTPTYGQVFTVPVGQTSINGFSFKLASVPASATFQGVLMQWDTLSSRAIGPVLYRSGDVNTTGATVQDVTFTISGGAPVTAGQTYVIFGSVVNSTGNGVGAWSSTPTDTLPGGTFVYQQTATEAAWTGAAWSEYGPAPDIGVAVDFAGGPAPVPTLSEWAMILFGLILAGGAALHIQRRRQFV